MNALNEIVGMRGVSLVDVRSRMEFESEHIPGTCNIPLDELLLRIEELKAMTRPLILFCRSGGRSAMAQQWLQRAGLSDVYNGGGISDMNNLLSL